jgi:hypothetical protein
MNLEIILLFLSLFLAWWHGTITGQLAQMGYAARRSAERKGKQYSENPLPDEQDWRKMLEKKQ